MPDTLTRERIEELARYDEQEAERQAGHWDAHRDDRAVERHRDRAAALRDLLARIDAEPGDRGIFPEVGFPTIRVHAEGGLAARIGAWWPPNVRSPPAPRVNRPATTATAAYRTRHRRA